MMNLRRAKNFPGNADERTMKRRERKRRQMKTRKKATRPKGKQKGKQKNNNERNNAEQFRETAKNGKECTGIRAHRRLLPARCTTRPRSTDRYVSHDALGGATIETHILRKARRTIAPPRTTLAPHTQTHMAFAPRTTATHAEKQEGAIAGR